MFESLKHLLFPNLPGNDDRHTYQLRLLYVITTTIVVMIALVLLGNLIGGNTPTGTMIVNILMMGMALVLRGLLTRIPVPILGASLLLFGFLFVTAGIWTLGTIRVPTTAAYAAIIVVAGILFGLRGMMATSFASSLAVAVLILAERAGMLPTPDYSVTITQWTTYTVLFVLIGSIAYSSHRISEQALERARTLTEERRRVAEELRVSEWRYRAIFNDAPVMLWEEDFSATWALLQQLRRSGVANFRAYFHDHPEAVVEMLNSFTVRSVNQAVLSFYGARDLNHLIENLPLTLTEEALETFKDALISLAEHQTYFATETSQRTFSGDTRHVFMSVSINPSDEGDFSRVILTMIDITERKQAETQLASLSQRLAGIIAGTNAGTWEWNIQTGETIFNERWAEMLGYSLEELAPISIDTWGTLSHPDDLARSSELLQRHFRGELDYYECEARMKHKQGNWIWVLDRGRVISWQEDGQPLMMMGTHQDITARKRAEELLAEKNRELEQLVYVASHDLRSPLVNVDGYGRELEYSVSAITTELMQHSAPDSVLEQTLRRELPDMTESLRRIRSSTQQMDLLLKGLLKLSRFGRAALDIGPIDMTRVVRQVCTSFDYQVNRLGVALICEPLPPCRGDAVQLTQVFSNLIDNALKYLDPARPGHITIRGSIIAGVSTYWVEDNGIGIAANQKERIFELFHRVNPVHVAGEGLGLSIVRQILNRLEGEISVDSTPGIGSLFCIRLPYAPLNETKGHP